MNFSFATDPFVHLETLLKKAESFNLKDFNAMYLATSGKDNWPSVRTVLFKGFVRGGLSFYTNYSSDKGQDLLENPQCSALFYWPPMDTQVRVTGPAVRLTFEESQAYFQSRPKPSQVGGWVSQQSKTLSSYEKLQKEIEVFEEAHKDAKVLPCPPHWGGFQILPLRFEFWFAHEHRWHHRFVYDRPSLLDPWTHLQLYP